jgi:hypothetical protein
MYFQNETQNYQQTGTVRAMWSLFCFFNLVVRQDTKLSQKPSIIVGHSGTLLYNEIIRYK